ncbi:methyl-accepting chemotaxis protein [Roseobacter sp.]|uniref:methyl-accepting chemotaxis protein n=1 Tax=Roseobacter sp. TaxID=1907202 RepID=UPI003297209B
MNVQANIDASETTDTDTLAYRSAIDRVLNLRSLVMRVAICASQMATDRSDGERATLQKEAQTQAEQLRHTLDVLRGDTVFSSFPEQLSIWLASAVKDQPQNLTTIGRMTTKTDALCEALAKDENVDTQTLDSYIAFSQGDFYVAVSDLVDRVWTQIETERKEQLDRSLQSATRLGEDLRRLERIGKYVRSMSINASVEASRAGEAGKGLAIIAQEFKVLAEEVQQLTLSARQDIETIENG